MVAPIPTEDREISVEISINNIEDSDSSLIESNEPIDNQTQSIEQLVLTEKIDESMEATVESIGIELKEEPDTNNKFSQENSKITTLNHEQSSNETTSPKNDNQQLDSIYNKVETGKSFKLILIVLINVNK